ncbi:hypothetical protein SAMN04487981_12867 [Streptomyces sp. cf386]|nr:hypothetical protein SAMN04487981_12867 [Streptomyces sp. cf386]
MGTIEDRNATSAFLAALEGRARTPLPSGPEGPWEVPEGPLRAFAAGRRGRGEGR